MTPTQLEHLRAIDAHLTALLDLAAKRTPGDWYDEALSEYMLVYSCGKTAISRMMQAYDSARLISAAKGEPTK